MHQLLILADLDNTIYNWVDFFGPSFRAMVHVLSKKTGVDEDTIISDFKDVFRKHGSIEYPFSVQELEIFNAVPEFEMRETSKLVQGVFTQVGMKHLTPYSGVIETLAWAVKVGILIICITNAPINLAEWRLKQLKIVNFFFGLAGSKNVKDKEGSKYSSRIPKHWMSSEIA
jgi:phosphoglycolate phosphatase